MTNDYYNIDFRHSIIDLLRTFAKSTLSYDNIEQITKNFDKHFLLSDYSNSSKSFLDGCYRYFRDIVIPHKMHVFNAGIELVSTKIFTESNINLSDFMTRLLIHDMSKFSFIEASGYVHKHFDNIDFTSPEFKLAWHHHKANNDHHSQYWYDIDKQGKLSCLDMSPIAIFEMFADFIGAGKTYGESFEEWFPKNCQNLILSEKTAVTVGHIASTLLDQSITIHRHEKIAGMYLEC